MLEHRCGDIEEEGGYEEPVGLLRRECRYPAVVLEEEARQEEVKGHPYQREVAVGGQFHAVCALQVVEHDKADA